jgi:hypothetical protein
MPRPRGLPKTGGRQKGTPNRVRTPRADTRRLVAVAVDEALLVDQSPLEYMLSVYRDPSVDERRRDTMAMAAAPYCHPRLQSAVVRTETPENKLPAEDYRLWARNQVRLAFGLKAVTTIEHQGDCVMEAAVEAAPASDDKVASLNMTPSRAGRPHR